MFAFVTQQNVKRKWYIFALLYNAFETKNSFDKFSLRFDMRPYRFIDLRSAEVTLQSSHLTTPKYFLFLCKLFPKWFEHLFYEGGLLNRDGLCVEMLFIINCDIFYSMAKIGPSVTFLIRGALDVQPYLRNFWKSVNLQFLGITKDSALLFVRHSASKRVF